MGHLPGPVALLIVLVFKLCRRVVAGLRPHSIALIVIAIDRIVLQVFTKEDGLFQNVAWAVVSECNSKPCQRVTCFASFQYVSFFVARVMEFGQIFAEMVSKCGTDGGSVRVEGCFGIFRAACVKADIVQTFPCPKSTLWGQFFGFGPATIRVLRHADAGVRRGGPFIVAIVSTYLRPPWRPHIMRGQIAVPVKMLFLAGAPTGME